MQLLGLALYAHDGRRRDVNFEPGKLNIVTGESKTGKSALMTITEFCLGRNRYLIPAGPIADTVAWYGSLWQLTEDARGARAFVGRPAPPEGQRDTQRAMLVLGGADLGFLQFDDLKENSDTTAVRRQLGRRIGIEENVIESRGRGMNQTPFEAHLGHAAWLCLQDQDEIANRNLLFHRQGESGVEEHLKDTIPYFLGAVPADAAAKKASMRDAQRALRRAESALAAAEQEAGELNSALRGLLEEAHAAGLTEQRDVTDREGILAALHAARRPEDASGKAVNGVAGPVPSDVQDRRRALQAQRDQLRASLDSVMDSRSLLLDRRDAERDFTSAVELHAGRLTSLDLLVPTHGRTASEAEKASDGAASDDAMTTSAETACPVCGQALETPDASVADLAARLTRLRTEVSRLDTAPESRSRLITALENQANELRGQLAAVEGAIEALVAADRTSQIERRGDASRSYIRGRIDATLALTASTNDEAITRLRNAVATARARVNALGAELDPEDEREQLISRLNVVGQSMTTYATQMALEHVGTGVRLDLANLTVVTDSARGPLPLTRIGSGANWIGYHLATHLALHKFLVENDRPVPHFLMIDQPTQAYYPSVEAKNSGQVADSDHAAVVAMFKVMNDVVIDLAPGMQVIVSDHVNLVDEDWFQEAIQHRWRDGVRLIPSDWIAELT